jgi:hypothetical protein
VTAGDWVAIAVGVVFVATFVAVWVTMKRNGK